MRRYELDVHTHTIASGHAYGTITEMARAASEKGLKILGITEHTTGIPGTCDEFYFGNMGVVPRNMFGIELMLGAEINILDYKGTLGLNERYFRHLDVRIAGIHSMCYEYGTMAENTQAIINTIKNPVIDIISHPDDGNCPLDYDEVVQAAKEYHVLLEINNNSLRSSSRKNTFENSVKILELCRKLNIPVLVSSDAHYMTDIANFENVEKVLDSVGFPEELVINSSADKFREFIRVNRERERF
ncbi:phosphatase [Sebaldella sp. S0638]|uniref:phosphatase n=1 Tax=Sebaldella sp. S0638 TaxID=2957809 RepID=UPI00209F9705|nr:phosphatase [Sebaldella sp. S0638]MCP1224887.1 phosphatase [Sebaldella sp. S0638]